MITIGILGLGEFSTKFYLDEFEQINEKSPEDQNRTVKIHRADFEKINALLPFHFQELIPIVQSELEKLNRLGVDRIVIPNMTLHLTIDRIKLDSNIKIKIIHPFHELVKEIISRDYSEITLMGTRHTMQSDEIKSYFTSNNIEVCSVSLDDTQKLDELRLDVFKNGSTANSTKKLDEIALKYPNPLIICTELSMINRSFLDAAMTQIHASFEAV